MSIQQSSRCNCHDTIIKFLQTENNQLKEQNKDYSDLVRLNKEMIRNLLQVNHGQNQEQQQLITQNSQLYGVANQMNILQNNNQNLQIGNMNNQNINPNCQQQNSTAGYAKENLSNATNQIQLQSSQRYAQAQSISSIQSMRFNTQKERTTQTAKGERTTACTTTKSESSNNSKVYEILFAQIAEENNSLYQIIQRVSKQRDTAQSKVLINEQIAEGIENQEKELINEYSDKLTNLNRIIQDQQNQIQLLLNQNPKNQSIPGTYIRYREIVLAKDSELRINNRLESSLSLVKSLQEKVQILEEEKKELIFINGAVCQELEKIRKQSQPYYNTFYYQESMNNQNFQDCQINIQDDQMQQFQARKKQKSLSSPRELDNQDKAINKINKVIHMETGESEELFIPDVIPDRVQLNKTEQNLNKVKVPSLDLSKAKKIQEINLQRQLEQLKQKEQMQAAQQLKQQISKDNQSEFSNAKNMDQSQQKINELDMKLLEKYKIVENEMFKARAFLEEEILKQQSIQKCLDESQRKLSELDAVNKTLIESNMLFQQKWKRLWDSYMFYREYYMKDSRKTCKQKRNQSTDSNIKFSNQAQNKESSLQFQHNFLFATQNYEYQYCQGNNIQQLNDYYSPESLCRQVNKKKQQIYMIHSPKQFNQNGCLNQQHIFQSPQQANDKQQVESEYINQPLIQPITESQLLEMASEYFLSQRQQKIPAIYDQQIYQNNQNYTENKAAIVNMALELYLDTQRRSILQKLSEGKKFRKRAKSLDFIQKLNTSQHEENGKKIYNLKNLKQNASKIRFPHKQMQYDSFQNNQNIIQEFEKQNKDPLNRINHIHHCCLCNENIQLQCHNIQMNQQNLRNNENFECFDELIEQINEQEKVIPKIQDHLSFGQNNNNQQKKEQIFVQNDYLFNEQQNRIIYENQIQIQNQKEETEKGIQIFSGDIITSLENINVSPEEVRITIMPNHYNKYFKTDIDFQQKNNFDYLQDELENLNETFLSSHKSQIQKPKNQNLNENYQIPYLINVIQPLSNLENQVSGRNSSHNSIINQQIPVTNQDLQNSSNSKNVHSQQQMCNQYTENDNQQMAQIEHNNSNKDISANTQYQSPSEKLTSNMMQDQTDQFYNNNSFNISNGSGDKSEILQENKFSNSIPFHPQDQKKVQDYRHHFEGQYIDQQSNNQINNQIADTTIVKDQGPIKKLIDQGIQINQQTAINKGERQENQNNSNNNNNNTKNNNNNNNQAQKDDKNISVSDLQLIVFD
ncbi:hypothetical protein ABPG74_008446 [Tetrahymena malaccensis]